jgi:hypothetical protein
MKRPTIALAAFSLLITAGGAHAQTAKLHPGAKVFIASMPNDFDSYFRSALTAKKVPVEVVQSREDAEFEITGAADSQKAGAAKKLFTGSWHSDEQASISVTHIKSGEVVYAYSANKKNSAHGKQSSAEACAKHLNEAIEKGK